MKNIAISARQISASIGNAHILRGIDLDLPAGRWTSVVGPNGAGKSTLLKALAGLLRHARAQGQGELLGRPLHAIPMRERARQLGGQLRITSEPGAGSCLQLWVPLP